MLEEREEMIIDEIDLDLVIVGTEIAADEVLTEVDREINTIAII